MDLQSVKTAVKAWEKGFRAKHGREPTKEDIKSDPSDIASQYGLYRKLTKSTSTTSSRANSSSTQRTAFPSSASSLSAGPSSSTSRPISQSRVTPRIIPDNEYPTTPTPPSRKSSVTPSGPIEAINYTATGGPSSSSSKLASSIIAPIPAVSERSQPRTSFITPKKPKAYSGPIHDPNPINPFSASPIKISPIASRLFGNSNQSNTGASGSGPSSSSSPFIHASSPKKLKEVLQANSLRKIQANATSITTEITPRTRARKRLRGEAVDDTPMKEKLPRKKRGGGEARSSSAVPAPGPTSNDDLWVVGGSRGKKTSLSVDDGEDEDSDDDEDDGLGPSPMKPSTFTALLSEDQPNVNGKGKGKGKEKEVHQGSIKNGLKRGSEKLRGTRQSTLGMFGKATNVPKVAKASERKAALPLKPEDQTISKSKETMESEDQDLEQDIDTEDILSVRSTANLHAGDMIEEQNEAIGTPPRDLEFEQLELLQSQQASTSKSKRPPKVLTLEDDEPDEWDYEGGITRQQVVIVPTRRAAIRVANSDDWDSDSDEADRLDPTSDSEIENGNKSETKYVAVPPEGVVHDDNANPESLPSLQDDHDPATTHSTTLPSSPASHVAPPLLSMLSLHSPNRHHSAKSRSLADSLRVKAIFNPQDAVRLKALKKGQEVHFAGEDVEYDEEEGILADGVGRGGLAGDVDGEGEGEGEVEARGGVFEDDDWDSENEGWKTTGVGMDDDEGW